MLNSFNCFEDLLRLWWVYVNLFHGGLFLLMALQAVGQANDRLVELPPDRSYGLSWGGTMVNYRRVPYVWVRSRNRAVDMTGHLHGPTIHPTWRSYPPSPDSGDKRASGAGLMGLGHRDARSLLQSSNQGKQLYRNE